MKKVIAILGLIAVLSLSACAAPVTSGAGQSVQPAAAQPAAPQPAVQTAPAQQEQPPVFQGQPRTLAVNGVGQVTLAPDVAYVYIGVQSTNAIVADALSLNNEKAIAVSNALKEMGIAEEDIQTSSFNIYPQQQYGPTGEITSVDYNVNNTVYITVRDLQKLAQLLDVVVRAGANSINGITFDVLDKSKAISQARSLAVESARSQAEEMAAAANVTLGEIYNLSVYSNVPPMPLFEGKGGVAMDASQVPVSSGQLVIQVQVSATYIIR